MQDIRSQDNKNQGLELDPFKFFYGAVVGGNCRTGCFQGKGEMLSSLCKAISSITLVQY